MIRPCRCSGSMAYVHATCLSEWRNTSRAAAQRCSICQHQYVTRSTFLRKFLHGDCNRLACWLSIMWFVLLCLIVHRVCIGIPFLHNALDKEARRLVSKACEGCPFILRWVPMMGMSEEVVCEPIKQFAARRIVTVMLTSIVTTFVGAMSTILKELTTRWPPDIDTIVADKRVGFLSVIVAQYIYSTETMFQYHAAIASIMAYFSNAKAFFRDQLTLLRQTSEAIMEPDKWGNHWHEHHM